MRKVSKSLVALLLTVALMLTACDSGNDNDGSTPTESTTTTSLAG